MLSGRLRHKVDFVDEDGNRHDGVRAQVRGIGTTESELAGMEAGEVTNIVMMRQSPNTIKPNARWTMFHAGREYRVRGAYDPKGQNRDWMIYAQEVV